MASTGLDLTNITPENGAIRDVAELLFLKFFNEPSALEKFCVFHTKVYNGDKVAGIGRFNALGKHITSTCNPTYGSDNVETIEKEWSLGRWAIFQKLCVDDIESTLVKHSLKSGTDVSDMTGDDYIDKILMPLLEDAITRAMWRMVWFGDQNAANATIAGGSVSGGIIAPGIDVDLFNTCDGLFKRLIKIATAKPEQRVAIDANTQTTLALQKSELREKGVATKLLDDVIDAMPAVLRQQENKAILITQSIADALELDIRNNNKGSELQWESIFNGITVTTYRGYTVYAIALWDEMLNDFFRIKSGDLDYIVNPHRIVATTLDNLLIATTSESAIAKVDAWFEKKENQNYIKVMDTLGTQIWQDNLCVAAY